MGNLFSRYAKVLWAEPTKPEPLRFSLKPSLLPRNHLEHKRLLSLWWEREFISRKGEVESSTERVDLVGHPHNTKDAHDSCEQCKQLRTPYGGLLVHYTMLTVTRDVSPIQRVQIALVPPKHRKCGTPQYHHRIQKKWNARAARLFQDGNARETQVFQLTKLQLHFIRDSFYR